MKTLNELFNSKINYRQIVDKEKSKEYLFSIGGNKYEIDFINKNYSWEILFYIIYDNNLSKIKNNDITGTGNEFKVFSTIIKIIKDFVKKYDPKILIFLAKEKSRIKLYDKMIKILAKDFKVNKSNGKYKLTKMDL